PPPRPTLFPYTTLFRSPEQSMANFMGYSGADFLAKVEAWIGRPLPDDFHAARAAEDDRVMAEGIGEVAGAVDFVQSLPVDLPKRSEEHTSELQSQSNLV